MLQVKTARHVFYKVAAQVDQTVDCTLATLISEETKSIQIQVCHVAVEEVRRAQYIENAFSFECASLNPNTLNPDTAQWRPQKRLVLGIHFPTRLESA